MGMCLSVFALSFHLGYRLDGWSSGCEHEAEEKEFWDSGLAAKSSATTVCVWVSHSYSDFLLNVAKPNHNQLLFSWDYLSRLCFF